MYCARLARGKRCFMAPPRRAQHARGRGGGRFLSALGTPADSQRESQNHGNSDEHPHGQDCNREPRGLTRDDTKPWQDANSRGQRERNNSNQNHERQGDQHQCRCNEGRRARIGIGSVVHRSSATEMITYAAPRSLGSQAWESSARPWNSRRRRLARIIPVRAAPLSGTLRDAASSAPVISKQFIGNAFRTSPFKGDRAVEAHRLLWSRGMPRHSPARPQARRR